jgi:parallel beta-helix repeat protein
MHLSQGDCSNLICHISNTKTTNMKQERIFGTSERRPAFTKKRFFWLLPALLLLVTACKKEITSDQVNADIESLSKRSSKAKPMIVVNPGSSIQSAVDAAAPGSLITIKPGVYKESITINKANLTLMGDGKVIIQNPGGVEIGIVVLDGADGFTLKNITLQDFTERGVNITYVDGFLLSHVTSINNGEFGLFSEFCKNGTIEHCETFTHRETGVFVGQSTNMNVTQNKSYENVIGFEVENSSYVTFDKNHAYDNSVGIMCLLVPGRTVLQSSNVTLTKNQVRDNNRENFSKPPEMESVLPSGVGILVIGIDNAMVLDNHVTGHQFTGIAVVSTLIIGALANLPPQAFAQIEPNPDGARIISNKVEGNGFNPPAGLPLPGVDLLWDGSGNNNCWSKNSFVTSYPSLLPACQ